MAIFKGIRKLSKKKYLEMLADSKLDPDILYVTEELTNIEIKTLDDTIKTSEFKGVVSLSDEQYQELITNGSITINGETIIYNDGTIYVTPDTDAERLNEIEGTVTNISQEVMRALKTPVSRPTTTSLVAVNSNNAQEMITIGSGLAILDDALVNTAGSPADFITSMTGDINAWAREWNSGRIEAGGKITIGEGLNVGSTRHIEMTSSNIPAGVNGIPSVFVNSLDMDSNGQILITCSVKNDFRLYGFEFDVANIGTANNVNGYEIYYTYTYQP